ncbi:MAG: hypothetical protein H3C31_04455 [Brumimicrobium sp.]|nr:hypothetical protein [Brumimicrobium sp.]MCO5268829.1 hypothetical protein [Brumimicrobium sp.]
MAEEYWKSSPFGEDSIFHPSWEEKQKQLKLQSKQLLASPKISIKCTGTERLKIKTDCVVSINFILGGKDNNWFGFEHHLELSSNDTNLKIYNDKFDVDNEWTFITNISNSKTGTSNLDIKSANNSVTTFKFDFVNEKSVFDRKAKDILLTENEKLVQEDKVCFRVADKELALLVNDKSLILNNYENLSGFSRMDDYEKKGYIYKWKKFLQNVIWRRHTEGKYELKPYDFADGQKTCFSDFIKETMPCMGIHVYHFILLDGYHVLVLIVDNSNNCYPKFKIIDQLKFREWEDFSKLDNELLTMTRNNYEGACNASKRTDINSSINLCKIKIK